MPRYEDKKPRGTTPMGLQQGRCGALLRNGIDGRRFVPLRALLSGLPPALLLPCSPCSPLALHSFDKLRFDRGDDSEGDAGSSVVEYAIE